MTDPVQSPQHSPEPSPAPETHEIVEVDVVMVDGEVVETTVVTTEVTAEVTAEGAVRPPSLGMGPVNEELKPRHETY